MISSHNILIADDEKVVSDLLNEQFKLLEEFEPVSVVSGGEVLKFIKKRKFDLVILGTCLPDMSCDTLYRSLRQMKIVVPIIFMLYI